MNLTHQRENQEIWGLTVLACVLSVLAILLVVV